MLMAGGEGIFGFLSMGARPCLAEAASSNDVYFFTLNIPSFAEVS